MGLTSCCYGRGTLGTFSASLRWQKSRQVHRAAEQSVGATGPNSQRESVNGLADLAD